MWRAPQQRAAPTSSTRWPGFTWRRRSRLKECSFADKVGRVVLAVPALLARLRRPRVDLPAFLHDAREPVVEHPRHAGLDLERAAAPGAGETVAVHGQLGRAHRAAENLEERRPHAARLGTQRANSPPLPFPFVIALAAIAALAASYAVIWAALRSPVFRRLSAAPTADRWHERETPLVGGLGIFA